MSSRPAGTRLLSWLPWKKKRALHSAQRFCGWIRVMAGSCPSSAWPLTRPMGLFSRMVTWLACWPWACLSISIRTPGSTCMPISATLPSTFTQPLPIHSSASRREAMPSSAMRLFRRTVPPAPWAAVLVWPWGMARLPGALLGGGAARRKVGAGGFWSVMIAMFLGAACAYFTWAGCQFGT